MKHLRALRIALAILFFLGVTWLFLDFTGVAQRYLGWMAKIQFLPAVLALNIGAVVAVLLITLLFGRIYCSVVCPLGVMQDGFSHMGGWFHKNRFNYVREHPWLRWGVFAIFVVLILAGVNVIAALIAPYSAYGRVAQNLFQPVYLWGNNLLAGWAEKRGSFAFHHEDIWMRSIAVFIVALVTFVLIGFLSLLWGRAWCNNICPVGTLLGFVSKYSLFKPMIDSSKCKDCHQCEHNCKAQCIDIDHHVIDYSRCVDCFDCLGQCKFDAVTYHRVCKKETSEAKENQPITPGVDEGKRKFIVATAMLTGAAVLEAQEKKVDGGLAVLEDKKIPRRTTPIKPAGAISLKHFAKHCTACQLCVAECPNGVLRPSKKLETLMQPEMSYERGYCRPECTRCSEVCPTGAITHITPIDKSAIHIGVAVWLADNCVVNTDGVSCGHCASHCPADAIVMVSKDKNNPAALQVPSVNETRCIGCGACENLCPARPYSAIHVEGREVHISQ